MILIIKRREYKKLKKSMLKRESDGRWLDGWVMKFVKLSGYDCDIIELWV